MLISDPKPFFNFNGSRGDLVSVHSSDWNHTLRYGIIIEKSETLEWRWKVIVGGLISWCHQDSLEVITPRHK
jgi:hypothetical protein